MTGHRVDLQLKNGELIEWVEIVGNMWQVSTDFLRVRDRDGYAHLYAVSEILAIKDWDDRLDPGKDDSK